MAHLKGVARVASNAYASKALASRKDAREDAATRALGTKIEGEIKKTVGKLFDEHSAVVVAANEKGLRAIGVRAFSDLGLDKALEARRQENIDLVVNAGREYAATVQEIISDPENEGLAIEELKALLLERGDVWDSRAELIARDQTLKMNGEINEIRQTNAGISSYTWSTSNDERVRDEHAELEGQEFSWDSPPDVGPPGSDFQCRCVGIPVIDGLEDL